MRVKYLLFQTNMKWKHLYLLYPPLGFYEVSTSHLCKCAHDDEEDSLENFPIDTSLETIAHSVLQMRSSLIFVSYASHDVSVKISSEGNFVILKAKGNPM